MMLRDFCKVLSIVTFLILVSALSPPTTATEPAPDSTQSSTLPTTTPIIDLVESITRGRLALEIRPRYAFIEESNKPKKTAAWTVRTLLGWQTAPVGDFRFTGQYIYTGILGPENLNTDPARFFSSPFPLLPDPAHAGINQIFADYTGLPETRIRLGRQILRINDEHFISDVDFRQTPQVFDGVTITNTTLPETRIELGEYRRIRTVLGGALRLRLHILHAAWNLMPEHTLSAYGYAQDRAATGAQTGFAHNAQRIVGLQAEGGGALNEGWRWLYSAAYARQSRIGEGDARIKATYSRVGVGFQSNGSNVWGARLDHEIKGSNKGVYGFQTPLSDYYAFSGWALQFTSTPSQGLRDTWITARGQLGNLALFLESHHYRSDFASLDLGREIDVSGSYPINPNLIVKLQDAQYRPGSGTAVKKDVDKTWLALTYTY